MIAAPPRPEPREFSGLETEHLDHMNLWVPSRVGDIKEQRHVSESGLAVGRVQSRLPVRAARRLRQR